MNGYNTAGRHRSSFQRGLTVQGGASVGSAGASDSGGVRMASIGSVIADLTIGGGGAGAGGLPLAQNTLHEDVLVHASNGNAMPPRRSISVIVASSI